MHEEAKGTIVSVVGNNRSAPFLFVCEHASNSIPKELGHLGLSDDARDSHIAWDLGAADVTKHLANAFDAPAVISEISRLVYDCNRPPEAPDCIPVKSEIFDVPGNQGLSEAQISKRVETFYQPFEKTLEDAIDAHLIAPVLVTLHSFTPVYHNETREVQLGILHDEDARFADGMLACAPNHTSLKVMRNEPYGPEHGVTHTLKLHGISRGLLNVMLEVRNDLLATPQKCASIAHMLAGLLNEAVHLFDDASRPRKASR